MNMDDLYRILRTGHMQLQGIVDTVSDPLLVLDSSLSIRAASKSFFDTFRVDSFETIGRPLYELGNGQWDIRELRELLTHVIPKATAVINFEVEHDFPEIGRRTMLVTARRLHDPGTTSHSMLLSIVDVTDATRAAASKDLMFGELRHRMNNLLAVAQSIARQSPTEGVTALEYRDAFLGRFAALIEAQDLAFAEHMEADLDNLLARVFAPYLSNPKALIIDPSPPVDIGPRKIMSLGMVFHELATNAAKYGALSVPSGQVRVGWRVEGDHSRLRLNWAESGGPMVTPPSTSGYGTKLITATMSYGLRGSLEQDYLPDGFRAEIVVPLRDTAIAE